MQLHPNEPSWGRERELLETCGLIGMGDWEEGGTQQQDFEHKMQKGDIVLIKLASVIIALTEVIGDYYYEEEVDDFVWFQRRRLVRILDWYKPEYKFSVTPRRTLTRCNMENDIQTNISIHKWHKMTLEKANMEKYTTILKNLKPQMILQGPPGTGKTYTAKDIAFSMVFSKPISSDKEQKKKDLLLLEDSGRYKLIQFHPSYSYEDFVRGITVKNNESVIEYITENKVFAEIAKDALANFLENGKDIEVITEEKWLKQRIEDYIISLNSRFVNGRVYLNDSKTFLKSINSETKYFVCYSDNYTQFQNSGFLINFERFQDIVIDTFKKDVDTCYTEFKGEYVELIKPFIKDFKTFAGEMPTLIIPEKKDDIKNYILVIDEINRANLPSVLGELIYALEYRGEPVESMYEIKGNRKIIIPPNLYIIGTMNTADRSVGHIDYAIRRRFAFVDILPTIEPLKPFALPYFNTVSSLFVKNYDSMDWNNPKPESSDYLATDFRPEDVWIGHSYFMADDEEQLKIKLRYEVQPILKEYLKDGILLESAKDIIYGIS